MKMQMKILVTLFIKQKKKPPKNEDLFSPPVKADPQTR